MKFSDRYMYIILCEDRQTLEFIRHVLKKQGISIRKIKSIIADSGVGSGEAFVRREYPKWLRTLRTYNYNKTALLICTDADRYSIKQRKDQLESFCQESGIVADSRNPNEPVMIWIPRHSIENWIHFFRDYPDKVSEETVYPHGGDPVKCREEAYIMSDYLQDISDFQEALQSLEDAKEEYRTLCNNQL